MSVHILTNITKEYPDMIKVMIYKEPKFFIKSDNVKRSKYIVDEEHYTPSITSLSRTKTLIRDIVLCNDFDYFCTFTFNPDKVDRYSYSQCRSKISVWLHRQFNRDDNFKYLIVPEQHKDGAWHFHALIGNFTGTMKKSVHFSSSGRLVYNITSYRGGFSTAVKIDNKEAVSNYVTKYITKDFIKKFNNRRFFCSRNLIRPIKSTNSPLFRDTLPIFRRQIGENEVASFYQIEKSLDF